VKDMTKITAVTERLTQLRALCDSGFALAIHIRYTRPTILYRTYDQAWIDHYSERGFMLITASCEEDPARERELVQALLPRRGHRPAALPPHWALRPPSGGAPAGLG